jgi:hypothetical protein
METTETGDGNDNDKKRKRPNVISGEIICRDGVECPNDCVEIDESDYRVVKEIYEDHLRFIKSLESSVATFELYEHILEMIEIEKDGADRRVHYLQIPDNGRSLPKSILQLDALETLDLEYSPSLVPRWLGELTSLKRLFICLGGDHSLPEAISDLSGLEYLGVTAWRHVKSHYTFPSSIGNLTNLAKMSIDLDNIPDGICNLTNLETLRLGSRVRSLPRSIGYLKNLKKIYYSSCLYGCLRSLPDEIGDLISLEVLDLTGSKVNSLPHTIGNLSNLKELKLPEVLSNLPDEIGNLTNLEHLHFRGPMSTFPSMITNLKNLRVLNLDFSSCHHILLDLVRDCPPLGCIGSIIGSVYRRNPKHRALAHALMWNRVKGRLRCSPNGKGHEISSPLCLWPLILKKANLAFAHSRQYCNKSGDCPCCGEGTRQSDAIFQLLVNYGATVLQDRRMPLKASRITTE